MESEQRMVARLMYDTYCEGVGGVAYNGDKLPDSHEFFSDPTKRKQADAWMLSAQAVIDFLNK